MPAVLRPLPSDVTRVSLRLSLLVLLAVVALMASSAGTASAHARLVHVSPGMHEQVARPPDVVTLRFNEDVSASSPSVSVTGPDGRPVSVGHPRIDHRLVTVSLAGQRPAGVYTIHYRVLTATGNTASGRSEFAARS